MKAPFQRAETYSRMHMFRPVTPDCWRGMEDDAPITSGVGSTARREDLQQEQMESCLIQLYLTLINPGRVVVIIDVADDFFIQV